jgi:predicted nucleic acid-binding protein
VTSSGANRPRHGLLDTSAVIALSSLTDADRLPQEPLISAITLAELSVGPHLAKDSGELMRRQAHVQQAEADFIPLPFDAEAARAFARVASDLRSSGRKSRARAFDALIAAVALSRDLPVYTANPSDFQGITGLTVEGL